MKEIMEKFSYNWIHFWFGGWTESERDADRERDREIELARCCTFTKVRRDMREWENSYLIDIQISPHTFLRSNEGKISFIHNIVTFAHIHEKKNFLSSYFSFLFFFSFFFPFVTRCLFSFLLFRCLRPNRKKNSIFMKEISAILNFFFCISLLFLYQPRLNKKSGFWQIIENEFSHTQK